jgi:hypothetical protein
MARLKQYEKAIAWWARVTLRRSVSIFVFENSHSSAQLSSLDCVARGQVTLVDVEPNSAEMELRGKGAGEARLLMEAARVTAGYERVIKCTGRLTVPNWSVLLSDARRYPPSTLLADWNLSLNRLDTRFFVVAPSELNQLAGFALTHVDERRGIHMEDSAAAWAVRMMPGGGRSAMFSRTPIFSGSSASVGTSYHPARAHVRSALEWAFGSRMIRSR